MNASELKIGDRVGYGYYGSHDLHSTGFGTVSKINGHGHIFVTPEKGGEPNVYDKHGKERAIYGKTLMNAAHLEANLAAVKAKRDAHAAAKAIVAELESHKNGCGDYFISAETKAKLAELVAALPVNYTPGA